MIESIMQRECAAIVTINMEEQRNPGTVPTISYTLMECAKTATSILTIEKEERKKIRRNKCQVSSKWKKNYKNDF